MADAELRAAERAWAAGDPEAGDALDARHVRAGREGLSLPRAQALGILARALDAYALHKPFGPDEMAWAFPKPAWSIVGCRINGIFVNPCELDDAPRRIRPLVVWTRTRSRRRRLIAELQWPGFRLQRFDEVLLDVAYEGVNIHWTADMTGSQVKVSADEMPGPVIRTHRLARVDGRWAMT